MSEFDYTKLRLDVLQKLIDERGISCKNKKDEMIKYLKMDDDGKYIRETTYEKSGSGFIVGVDLKNQKHLMELSKMIEKKDAHRLNRYSSDLLYYWSPQKLI